jgi:hypothetical protein
MHSREYSEDIRQMAMAEASALAAMLHFRRTGQRYKPRLVVVNPSTVLSLRPRPTLRAVSAEA